MDNKFARVVGYADNLILLFPTLDGLQDMVKSCEVFAKDNNLLFSTHHLPDKCKTKCIAFVKKEKCLNNIILNGEKLPWVVNAKHLGCKISANIHGLSKDMMEKRAQYINRANELDQEFHFASPSTRVWINQVFNTSYFGSQLWGLFNKEEERIEKTWNVSQRIFLRLPRNSHRYFIEPLSGVKHIRESLRHWFVNFTKKILASDKAVLRTVFHMIKRDCRSTTGENLRKIMLILGETNVEKLESVKLLSKTYVDIPTGDEWKINIAKELLDTRNLLIINGFKRKELDEMLEFVTTN